MMWCSQNLSFFSHFLSALCAGFWGFRLLMQKVAPLFTRKGLEFKVEYVTSIRAWVSNLPKISTMYGSYRRRTIKDADVVPHSFTFLRRESILTEFVSGVLFPRNLQLFLTFCQGMPSSLLDDAEERMPSWHTKTPRDVFVLVKAYVSDDTLCQKPLLVLPGCKMEDVDAAFRKLARSDAPCCSVFLSL